jgi:hypothetical protein
MRRLHNCSQCCVLPCGLAHFPGTADANGPADLVARRGPQRAGSARASQAVPLHAKRRTRALGSVSSAGIPPSSLQRGPEKALRRLAWIQLALLAALASEAVDRHHRLNAHPPKSLVQSSRCVKDLAMRPVRASLSHPCGRPLGVGFSAVPRWLPLRHPAGQGTLRFRRRLGFALAEEQLSQLALPEEDAAGHRLI